MDDAPLNPAPDPSSFMARCHLRLSLAFAHALLVADWDDPGAVALLEKRSRILAANRTNTDKLIVHDDDRDAITAREDAEARRDLKAKIDRIADRLRGGVGRDRGPHDDGGREEGDVELGGVGEGRPEAP